MCTDLAYQCITQEGSLKVAPHTQLKIYTYTHVHTAANNTAYNVLYHLESGNVDMVMFIQLLSTVSTICKQSSRCPDATGLCAYNCGFLIKLLSTKGLGNPQHQHARLQCIKVHRN